MTGPAIASLALSHFRSYVSTRLEAGADPVVLCGPNGAGKTNVLEAISMLSPGRGLRRAASVDLARRPEALGWKVTAELDGRHRHQIETWAEDAAPRQVRVDGKPAPQVALGRLVRILWLVPSMDRLWTEAPEGRRRFLDRVTLSFHPGHGGDVTAFERAMRERNRLLREDVRDVRWFAALEGRMAEAGAAIAANRHDALRRLAAAFAEAQTAFPVADLALVDEAPTTAEALAELWARSRERDQAVGRTLAGPHRADLAATYVDKGMAARDCSTGEQKALLISLVLANARALSALTGAAPILLLDEVAAHLDVGRRTALYDEIAALGAQAWMTGTDRHLFDALAGRARFFAVEEDDGTSRVLAA